MIDDDWVNAGLAEAVAASVAKARTSSVPNQPSSDRTITESPMSTQTSPSVAQTLPTKGPRSLSALGVDVKGGVIRNKSTKIKTYADNPVANPRPSPDQRQLRGKAVPAPDPLSDLKASNPALAAPTLFTGMDVDVNRKTQARPTEVPPPAHQAPAPAPAMQEFQPTMDTTIRQLLEQARLRPDKIYSVTSDGRFMIKTTLLSPGSTAPG